MKRPAHVPGEKCQHLDCKEFSIVACNQLLDGKKQGQQCGRRCCTKHSTRAGLCWPHARRADAGLDVAALRARDVRKRFVGVRAAAR